jgi:hypothetical protein
LHQIVNILREQGDTASASRAENALQQALASPK